MQAAVHLDHVKISPPSDDGVIQVQGEPGAVTGGAREVRLTLLHPVPVSAYRLAHLGFGAHEHYYFEVLTVDLPVNTDGSFGPTTVGSKAKFAQHFDELDFTALVDDTLTGATVTASVP
ncbi:MAG: hypothetical protein JWM80_4003 [Cyanobacteria bacterium RYN_339]|nr:hypothetical protein [Cyanobacteria bacterium RYN_339]